jgi:hypothetical protein
LEFIFSSVDKFAESDRPDSAVSLLLYRSRYGPSERLLSHRELLPDYVRLAQYGNKGDELIVFAASCDVRQYVPLLDMLDAVFRDDESQVAEIKLAHIEPGALAERLHNEFPSTFVYRPLMAARQTEPAGDSPDLRVWTDWAHCRVIVGGKLEAVGKAQSLAHKMDRS